MVNSEKAPARSGRAKVKTGCRTCKARKVKCDEARPACRRCVTSGRTCDGYGIWGGGGNSYGHRSVPTKAHPDSSGGQVAENSPATDELGPECSSAEFASPSHPIFSSALSIPGLKPEERVYLDWFVYRSLPKLPGVFPTGFWDSVLIQSSVIEPAVLHAVMALSAVHMSDWNGDGGDLKAGVPGAIERFALDHYSKAIRHLGPHFSTRDRSSVRVALITCVIFITLEYMRGHYVTGITHLQNGLKLLRGAEPGSEDWSLVYQTSLDPVDDWIIEAMLRLHIQAKLFGQGSPALFPALQHFAEAQLSFPMFANPSDARKGLDRLLGALFQLAEACAVAWISSGELPAHLYEEQRTLRNALQHWLSIHEATTSPLRLSKMSQTDVFAYQLLSFYYTMADLISDCALSPLAEMVFDEHTHRFISIITRAIGIFQSAPTPHFTPKQRANGGALSISDIGWIPPLFVTALKCRVHRIRLQAIRLLEVTGHKEGIWNATLVARAMRVVMEFEEGDFYADWSEEDDFDVFDLPRASDIRTPTLPKERRVLFASMVLPDGVGQTAKLRLGRHGVDGTLEEINGEISLAGDADVPLHKKER